MEKVLLFIVIATACAVDTGDWFFGHGKQKSQCERGFSGYSLTAPSIMPDRKYRCRKGYIIIMGNMVTTTEAILMLSP